MVDLTYEERAVLQVLSGLEPATLAEIAALAGLSTSTVKDILEALAKKGLLASLDRNNTDQETNNSEKT